MEERIITKLYNDDKTLVDLVTIGNTVTTISVYLKDESGECKREILISAVSGRVVIF